MARRQPDKVRATGSKPPLFDQLLCALWEDEIHTVETSDFTCKFIGGPVPLALVPDKNKFKFQIDKDARVYLQDKKGHTVASSLRFYSKTAKASQALIPLPAKAKPKDWRVANVTRMQPILFSSRCHGFSCLPNLPVFRLSLA